MRKEVGFWVENWNVKIEEHFDYGPYETLEQANFDAEYMWNELTSSEKKKYQINVYKAEISYDDEDEVCDCEYLSFDGLAYRLGQGSFIFNDKKYEIDNLDEYESDDDGSVKLKDLIVDWNTFKLFRNYSSDSVISVYRAASKDGKHYEIAIDHDVYDGVLSSKYDEVTNDYKCSITKID